MKQSRSTSFIKSVISTGVGFGISLAAQYLILPLLGVPIAWHQNIAFAVIMTVISIGRGYMLERVFEFFGMRVPMSAALLAVAFERKRQIDAEGWSLEHDDRHDDGSLAYAGAAYIRHAADTVNPFEIEALQGPLGKLPPPAWPWDHTWWKPADYRRNLIKGLALGLADLERFDRNRRPRAKLSRPERPSLPAPEPVAPPTIPPRKADYDAAEPYLKGVMAYTYSQWPDSEIPEPNPFPVDSIEYAQFEKGVRSAVLCAQDSEG